MAKTKGTKFTTKFKFVEEKYGKGAIAEIIGSMSEQDQSTFRSMMDAGWYPLELYERFLNSLVTHLSLKNPSILADLGTYTAERQLSTTYKAYQASELVKTLKNQASMHKMINDPGSMDVEMPAPRHCVITVREPRSTQQMCAIARAFYRRTAELSGATNVRVHEPRCSGSGAPACEFHIEWD